MDLLGLCQFSYRPPLPGGEFWAANVKFEHAGKRIGAKILFQGNDFYEMRIETRSGDFVHDRELERRVAQALKPSSHELIELMTRANQPSGGSQA